LTQDDFRPYVARARGIHHMLRESGDRVAQHALFVKEGDEFA
jgi:hypothetical protein